MKNIERIVRQINQIYYLVYTSTILATIIGYYITMYSNVTVNQESEQTILLSSIIILYVLISVPTALALFHRKLKTWSAIEDDFLKGKKYIAGAQLRLGIIGLGIVMSIIGHFILYVHTPNMTMIGCAGIAAVALFFCKPSVNKVANELNIEIEE